MKSVIENLNTKEFPRVRIGIGKPEHDHDLINYVTGKILNKEKEQLEKSVNMAADAVIAILKNGIGKAMNDFNGRKI